MRSRAVPMRALVRSGFELRKMRLHGVIREDDFCSAIPGAARLRFLQAYLVDIGDEAGIGDHGTALVALAEHGGRPTGANIRRAEPKIFRIADIAIAKHKAVIDYKILVIKTIHTHTQPL